MKKKIQSIGRKIWAVAFLFPLVALAQWTKPGSTNLPTGSVFNIIKNVMNWLLGILGFVAVIGFVISGIMFLISAGDEDRMQSAKRNMLYAIIGVVVVLSSFVIIQAIQYALEAKSMF